MSYFPDGFSIIWDGQPYRPIVVKDHTKLDGGHTKLVEWETECPGCGRTFRIMTGLVFTGPRRRCDDCKVSGRTVRSDRKLFRQRVSGEKP
jgi:hypothetical protein